MKTSRATVAELSRFTRAVLTYTPSGRLGAVTLLRGREAFTLADNEARALLDAAQLPLEPSSPRESG